MSRGISGEEKSAGRNACATRVEILFAGAQPFEVLRLYVFARYCNARIVVLALRSASLMAGRSLVVISFHLASCASSW